MKQQSCEILVEKLHVFKLKVQSTVIFNKPNDKLIIPIK